MTSNTTGVIYDERMAEHKCLWVPDLEENPERFTRVMQRCQELNLIQRCLAIKPREATEEELLKMHSPESVEILKSTQHITDADTLEELCSNYDHLYIHPSTYKLALLAAGCSIDLVDSVVDGKIKNGMAIIRPPGHHAMKSEFCGYCFYNNVALAARHALDNKGLQRILIVDWDAHHGQATQQMFYDDPRVMYFSIHRYEKGAYWPNLRECDYHYTGRGNGLGYNVNIPINKIKMGNSDYMAIFQQVLLPIAHEFNPELIIVSAGYDAALGCPSGEMEVTPACYSHFTSSLMGLAGGKIAVVMEGGYCLKSLAEGAALTLRTLLGDPCPVIDSLTAPCETVRETILNATYALRSRWNCFQHLENFSAQENGNVMKIHEVSGRKFWPSIEFYGTDEKVSKYPTRNNVHIYEPEEFAELDSQLNALINRTCLDVPQHRVAFLDTTNSPCWKDSDVIERCYHLSLENINIEESALKFMDSLIDGDFRSGVFISGQGSTDVVNGLKHCVDNRSLERVLCIDWRMERDERVMRKIQDDPRIVYTSIYEEQNLTKPKNPAQKNMINIGLPLNNNASSAALLNAVFRVLLPMAYQFNPQIVFVLVDDGGSAAKCFSQVSHQLSSLAGGRLAFVIDRKNYHQSEVKNVEKFVKSLLGDAIPMVRNSGKMRVGGEAWKAIRSVIRAQSDHWSAYQFDVELPEENVLIPPFMKDENVLKFNPELKKLQ